MTLKKRNLPVRLKKEYVCPKSESEQSHFLKRHTYNKKDTRTINVHHAIVLKYVKTDSTVKHQSLLGLFFTYNASL